VSEYRYSFEVRFGQPATAMPGSVAGGGAIPDVADLGTYSQTLPQARAPQIRYDRRNHKMRNVIQQLNWGLLLSRRVHGGTAPNVYRKAWRSLLTISLNLQGALSESLECELERAVQAMLDLDKSDGSAAVNSLQDLANTIASQGGKQIPQADANALLAAVQQLIQLARRQHVWPAEESSALNAGDNAKKR